MPDLADAFRASALLAFLIFLPSALRAQVDPGEAILSDTELLDPVEWAAAAADTTQSAPLVIPRVDPALVEGGRLPAHIWERIPPLPMSQHFPDNGADPTERTEVRIAHDGQAVYLSARMYDRDPDGIQAPSLKRDQIPHTNDFFGILFDSFFDRETGYGFWTNPVGLRTDVLTQNDASPPGAYNYDYNAFWDVTPERNEEGWFSEMRIPFAALRFEPVDGEVQMGIITYRRIARKNEWSTFPHIPESWGAQSHFMPSNARPVIFQGVERPRLFLITPYVMGGVERSHFPETGGTVGVPVWDHADRQQLEAGVDLKVGVTSNLTLDLTVNPDFAQVEADDQQVNLSRFSLFFPEKRRFFQERSSAFDFSFGGTERLFYTRQVGISGGTPVRIPVGARLAGRVGAWDVGALNVQTLDGPTGQPGANHGVLRLKRTVLNSNSYAGGMVTSLVNGEGRRSFAYGLDASLRLSDSDYLILQWAQTFNSEEEAAGFLDRGIARAQIERRGNRGILYGFDARRVGARFLPSLGFIRQTDYVRIGDRIGYGWTPGPDANFTARTLELRGSALRRSSDGVVESFNIGPRWSVTTRSGYDFTVGGTFQREDLDQGFDLPGDNRVEVGRYEFGSVSARVGTPIGDLRGISLDVEGGSFYDGRSISVGASPRINLTRHLEFRGRYQYDRVRFPDRGGTLDAHVGRLRLEHQMSTKASWVTFVQYNSATDAVIGNVRVLYSPREGSDLHIVYNTGGNAARGPEDPDAPFLDTQTLLVKLSITTGPGS
ncbi:MAG: DUF5916 domain-containing protein [Gemmatimonadota bacterium]